MPIKKQLASDVDAYIDGVVGNISIAQGIKHGQDGQYKQEEWTHNTPPADGVTKTPDRAWETFALPTKMICSIKVLPYETVEGEKGWGLEAKVVDRGITYIKRRPGAGLRAAEIMDFEDWTELSP